VHFQDVDTTGETALGGKSDYLTSYDFDGDRNGRNNRENIGRFALAATKVAKLLATRRPTSTDAHSTGWETLFN
jgi:hypothetical protein